MSTVRRGAKGAGRRHAGTWVGLVAALAGTVLALRLEGRPWWCACGQPFLWSGQIWSPHNSQHLLDPYSLTHVLHGIAFCGLLAWGWPRLPGAAALAVAVAGEGLWELLENSRTIIERYRSATISLNYTGDTVANSLGDVLACGVGFLLARRIGWLWSLAVWILIEGVLVFWIRDNLLLSALMLVYPIPAIKAWQTGG